MQPVLRSPHSSSCRFSLSLSPSAFLSFPFYYVLSLCAPLLSMPLFLLPTLYSIHWCSFSHQSAFVCSSPLLSLFVPSHSLPCLFSGLSLFLPLPNSGTKQKDKKEKTKGDKNDDRREGRTRRTRQGQDEQDGRHGLDKTFQT